MAENGVATTQLFQKTAADIGRLQKELATLQQQITSGRKASSFTELGADISRVLDLEASLKSTQRFINGNEIVLSRLRTMDQSVSQIQEVATNLLSQLALERSSSGNDLDITEFARTALDQIADNLNVRQNGRTLFAGGKTNSSAINNIFLQVSNIFDGQPTASYYQGDDLTFTTQASENLSLEYGIKANDPAFQNLIGALHKAIDSEEATGTNLDLEEAVTLANTAVQELARVRNKINTDILTLEGVNEQHERSILRLNESLSDQVATDVVEASVQVAETEAVLTATMQTFARISQLTLVDFLN